MKKSIIIITSEMQLYNAIEAIEYFNSDNNTLIVSNYTNRNKRIFDQFKVNEIAQKFNRIINLNPFNSQSQFYYYCFNVIAIIEIFIISLFNNYDFVMIGNYVNPMHRYLAYRFKKTSRIIVLDDGNLTYSVVKIRAKEKSTNDAVYSNSGNRITRLLKMLMQKSSIFDSVTLFTSFKLELDYQKDEVVPNNYRYLKANGSSLFSFPEKNNAVFLIGSPFPEIGMISFSEYSNILSEVMARFPSRDVIYISHPSEKKQYLPDNPRFQMLRLVVPCELLATSLPEGTLVLGFCSSAIQNIHMIRPDLDVRFIDIRAWFPIKRPVIDSQIDVWKAIDDTYQSMAKSISELKL